MILNARHIEPVISFGLGRYEITCAVGDTVTVWQSKLFPKDYDLILVTNLPKVIVSPYQYEVTPDAVGVYEIQLTSSNKDKDINKKSNTLILTVE